MFGDLPASTRDSRWLLLSFLRDLVERPPVGLEGTFV